MILTEVTQKMDLMNDDERRDNGKRYFSRGGVKLALLTLLESEPMHGYQMMKALEEQSGGLYIPSAGSIYPTLQMLVKRGFAAVMVEDGGKKVYRITDQGRTDLKLLSSKTKPDAAENERYAPKAESFRNDKIRMKLGLSHASYDLLRLVKQAEQEASASLERKEKLQRLLNDQHQQLNAFLASREQDTAAREVILASE
jgi:DNA-binding PadR family transcriptional regulator